ncbi:hypothetical protein PPSIR1_00335 [Plesiocystis pacifica SIR-1]|uniref:Uncharacterized protein n=1 Tax=Plesiocystis pacifica SIR-1 TaxID=391625 RepID=A6GGB3_9BACT|nr:hypothetical protein [Plesiocystis pacifica]EDM75087.1 hypothetical protein PPSIR1_00335 [Plesiocystis pacifica SIR-1]
MAYANTRLIQALRTTAARMREGAPYQWGHHGQCNCGQLAQTITQRGHREIHEAAMSRGGEWRDRARDYCPTSGLPIDGIVRELLAYGLSPSDLADLEYLGDDRVYARVVREGGPRELRRNERDHVVLYIETWATMLEEQLAAREAGMGAVA